MKKKDMGDPVILLFHSIFFLIWSKKNDNGIELLEIVVILADHLILSYIIYLAIAKCICSSLVSVFLFWQRRKALVLLSLRLQIVKMSQ